jgi:hypothetical protein
MPDSDGCRKFSLSDKDIRSDVQEMTTQLHEGVVKKTATECKSVDQLVGIGKKKTEQESKKV